MARNQGLAVDLNFGVWVNASSTRTSVVVSPGRFLRMMVCR